MKRNTTQIRDRAAAATLAARESIDGRDGEPLFSASANGRREGPSAMEFAGALTSVHNHVYANDGLSAAEAFTEIVKILLLKILDEARGARVLPVEPRVAEALARGERSAEALAYLESITGLFDEAKRRYKGLFRRDEVLHLKPTTLTEVIRSLDSFRLSALSYDVKGTAFQRIVGAAYRGERGQFFTPEPVTRLLVEMTAPVSGERVCDPACGTGGFLLEALRYVRARAPSATLDVFGGEINPGVGRVALLQLILAGVEAPQIKCGDTLADAALFGAAEGTFDVVVTNPPFGSQGKITTPSLLERYDLGHRLEERRGAAQPTATLLPGQVPDILFIERCLHLLRPGGRLGIVLPNGDLENSSLRLARLLLRDRAALLASVALPPETFIPFGTGVRASVLLLRKKPTSEPRVFMAAVTKIGYSGGKHPREIVLRDAEGEPLLDAEGFPRVDEDVTAVIGAYHEHAAGQMEECATRFTVAPKALGDRFDPNFYSPEVSELGRSLVARGAVPLANVVEVRGKRARVLADPKATIRYVELSDVNPDSATITTSKECRVQDAPSRAAYEVREGDVLIGASGNATGTSTQPVAIVTAAYAGAICSNGFRVLRARGIDPLVLVALLRSEYVLRQIFRCRTGAAIPAICDADLMAVLVVLPSQDVQTRIVESMQKALLLHEQQTSLLRDALRLANSAASA